MCVCMVWWWRRGKSVSVVCFKEKERGDKLCIVKHKGLIQASTKGKFTGVLLSYEKPLQGMPEAGEWILRG